MNGRPNSAARLLLTPKWIAITVLVIAASGLFAVASSWQYHRAVAQVEAGRVADGAPQPIEALVPAAATQVPDDSLGRVAVAEGTYSADAWVVGRASATGEPGVWLVSALDDGSGTLTAVLRGWLPAKDLPADGGQAVTVTGRVSSSENFYTSITPDAPGDLVAITAEGLAAIWDQPIRPGYLVLTAQEPALGASDPQPVPAVFGTAEHVDFPWQNAAYAVQWLFFIGFAGFMYLRMFRDDLSDGRAESEAARVPA